MQRTRNLPGKYSDEEMDRLAERAEKSGLELSAYIRRQLKMPAIKIGAPAGNNNNPYGRTGKEK